MTQMRNLDVVADPVSSHKTLSSEHSPQGPLLGPARLAIPCHSSGKTVFSIDVLRVIYITIWRYTKIKRI